VRQSRRDLSFKLSVISFKFSEKRREDEEKKRRRGGSRSSVISFKFSEKRRREEKRREPQESPFDHKNGHPESP
jgi:hypothetical protein